MNRFLSVSLLLVTSALFSHAGDKPLSIEIAHAERHTAIPSNYAEALKSGKKTLLTPKDGNCLLKVIALMANTNTTGDPITFHLTLSGITITPTSGTAVQAIARYNNNKRWVDVHKEAYDWPRPVAPNQKFVVAQIFEVPSAATEFTLTIDKAQKTFKLPAAAPTPVKELADCADWSVVSQKLIADPKTAEIDKRALAKVPEGMQLLKVDITCAVTEGSQLSKSQLAKPYAEWFTRFIWGASSLGIRFDGNDTFYPATASEFFPGIPAMPDQLCMVNKKDFANTEANKRAVYFPVPKGAKTYEILHYLEPIIKGKVANN